MPNECFLKRTLTLARPVDLPPRLLAMLEPVRPNVAQDHSSPAPVAPRLVHRPADAETVAENQRKEREWEAAHAPAPRFEQRPADDETQLWNEQREAEWHGAPGEVETLLCELCPAVFRTPPIPLKIGIGRDLVALLAGEFEAITIGLFLRNWTRQGAYREAIRHGGFRHDLNGLPCGEVTDSERGRGAVP